jgi:hypothetical protein
MTEEEIRAALDAMVQDKKLSTNSVYSFSSERDDHRKSFADVHIEYLRKHKADPKQYLANLKLRVTHNS